MLHKTYLSLWHVCFCCIHLSNMKHAVPKAASTSLLRQSCLPAPCQAALDHMPILGSCLQVGYCQGMAFIAGIMLMYVPEEPAFRLLARLMGENSVGMRALFLPGLAGLKQALRMFEWLLARIMPGLRLHLEVSLTPAAHDCA